jgi:hypothetical protein
VTHFGHDSDTAMPGTARELRTDTLFSSIYLQAGMAELADALDLGSSAVKGVQVQVLFPAPTLRSLGFARDCGSGLPFVSCGDYAHAR